MKTRTVNYPIRKTIRFTPIEVEKLEILLNRSAYCQTISELVRDMLFKRKLTLNTRNESLEKIFIELGLLRNELNKIGVNINQITHFFNMEADPKERQFFLKEMLPHFEKTKAKIDSLHGLIERLKIPK
ncbi:mobilization protein MobC [Algoriphagus ratkowskyi]|uniref:Mobilization protein MobC n=1 Tax=Algoriphagus ratkowskyi TaxID=57028 RepID=A0A2W7RXQ8_9BACT|nr:plasmid mobilization relaxosome protein MobC [Algoriphagus ratkowskyi]PZX59379.1 mobilization protein MobC [Algoriphagus ratkowskyi]TXD77357.1 plasmid mobilization relaxosome protein MobC [Algoriphagus ratkowskyi]